MNNFKFEFDKKIKSKEYSSKYFINTEKIFEKNNLGRDVTLRFFHFNNNVCVAGIEECISLLKFCNKPNDFDKLNIWYVEDGTITQAGNPILIINGDYKYFGYLENIIDGILSRRSSIATNCNEIIKILGADKLIYMADRSDDYLLQKYDGYAAYIGGVRKFCTKQHIEFISNKNGVEYSGTIPHALIQQFDGNLNNALIAYKKIFPNEKIIALVDYNNDCLSEIEKLSKLNFKIHAIRLDTSKKLVDKSLQKGNWKSNKNLYGVNEKLILLCRNKLDELGMNNTKIIISSSINIDKIKKYHNKNIPIDFYGVGKSLLNINVHYTGDLIKTGNRYSSKYGRNKNIDKLIEKMKKLDH